MSFYGESFFFDGVPSEQFGLLIYNLDSSMKETGNIGSNVEIIEDRISRRYDSLHYGTIQNEPLKFTLTFGSMEYLDRYDLTNISAWLTGQNQYKWLDIFQPDMGNIRYKCILNNMNFILIGNLPVAFTCDVICDSPFAYTYPIEYPYTITTPTNLTFHNQSSYQGYFFPLLEIKPNAGVDKITIKNKSDANRIFEFSGLAGKKGLVITVDNQNQLITTNSKENLYSNFNYHFLRLIKGDNLLEVTGNCNLKFTCEYPIHIGG